MASCVWFRLRVLSFLPSAEFAQRYFEPVDTPGLGPTLNNALNAADAASTCDLVLRTVDAQKIGGAREAAMLDCIHESGQSLICALTKSNKLDAEDIEPIVTYVAEVEEPQWGCYSECNKRGRARE